MFCSSYTTQEAMVASPWVWLMSKHSRRLRSSEFMFRIFANSSMRCCWLLCCRRRWAIAICAFCSAIFSQTLRFVDTGGEQCDLHFGRSGVVVGATVFRKRLWPCRRLPVPCFPFIESGLTCGPAWQAGRGTLRPSGKPRLRPRQTARIIPGDGANLKCASPKFQARGRVTPRWPWYLPPRSRYETSQTSSDSKNSTWAQPSPA